MNLVEKVKRVLLLIYITATVSATVGFLILKQYNIAIIYIILQVYIGLHMIAPFDWYFLYKFIKWLVKR